MKLIIFVLALVSSLALYDWSSELGLPELEKRRGGGHAGGGGRGGGGSSGSSGGGSSGGSSRAGRAYEPASQRGKAYGSNARDYAAERGLPPPYSRTDPNQPPPYSPSVGQSYGQRGSTRSFWNGQYYPYSSFGYASFMPIGFAAPFLLAGPFGYYGHYCRHEGANCTTTSVYVNGTENSDGDLVNGTFYTVRWEDGEYRAVSGDRGTTYSNYTTLPDHPNIAVNGTSHDDEDSYNYDTINPNTTANGSDLKYNASAEDGSDNAGAEDGSDNAENAAVSLGKSCSGLLTAALVAGAACFL